MRPQQNQCTHTHTPGADTQTGVRVLCVPQKRETVNNNGNYKLAHRCTMRYQANVAQIKATNRANKQTNKQATKRVNVNSAL